MTRLFHVLARWTRLLMLAVAGSVVIAYAGPSLANWAESKLDFMAGDNPAALYSLSGLLLLIALSGIHLFAEFRLQHVRWISYPPLPFAVVLSFLMACMCPSFARSGAPLPRIDSTALLVIAGGYFVFWLASSALAGAVLALKASLSPERILTPRMRKPLLTLDELTDEQLTEWMAREQPITSPEQDLFGFWQFTENVFEKLAIPGNTIAIQGGFGSGKTSFIHLLECRAARRGDRIYFARVSCWGFEEAGPAQRNVLSSLVRSLNDKVECLSIRGLPSEYIAIVSKKLEWLSLLAPIDETPVEQLQRVTPILSAIGARMVVVVEDVDRTGQRFEVGTVFALLAQFREVRNLSFILAISPHQSVDFAKLCESTETLPTPTRSKVAGLCQRVREALIAKFPNDILVDKLENLMQANQVDSLYSFMLPGTKNWPSAAIQLLRAPRFLKRALRRLSNAWEILHGEVSIDALLMICVLREAAPAALSFLQAELDGILDASREATKYEDDGNYLEKLRSDLKQRWQRIVDRNEFDARQVEVIIKNLFVGTSFLSDSLTLPTPLKQGPSGTRAKIYALRLFNERVEVSE